MSKDRGFLLHRDHLHTRTHATMYRGEYLHKRKFGHVLPYWGETFYFNFRGHPKPPSRLTGLRIPPIVEFLRCLVTHIDMPTTIAL